MELLTHKYIEIYFLTLKNRYRTTIYFSGKGICSSLIFSNLFPYILTCKVYIFSPSVHCFIHLYPPPTEQQCHKKCHAIGMPLASGCAQQHLALQSNNSFLFWALNVAHQETCVCNTLLLIHGWLWVWVEYLDVELSQGTFRQAEA